VSGAVVVTGASGGLGVGVAACLAEGGAAVVSLDPRPPAAGHRLAGHHAIDVRDRAAVDGALDAVAAAHGRVDALVNCHGVMQAFGPVAETPDEEVRRVMSVNFEGTFTTCRAVAPRLVAQGGGRIVNVASQAGKVPWPDIAVYGASKAAVIALTQALALELGPAGVTANAVCPGVMDTEMTIGAFGADGAAPGVVAERLRAQAEALPVRRLGTPADVGELVAWLLSPAAAFMTGATLNLTGGQQFF
jgi:NAD(P)-dependent dehydrogenase (short-subunit alcohol dehydrogenase family)